MIDIGSRKQLFIDNRFIEFQSGITLSMNTPVQHPEPVLVPDKPWEEEGIGGYNTVWREPEDGRFRMWYNSSLIGGYPAEGAQRVAYAESEDGIHWVKPNLGLITFRGSRDNNLVAPLQEAQSTQGATVLRDDGAPAAERYKLWSKFRPTDAEIAGGAEQGLWAMHSEDGIRWHVYPDQPNPDVMCDTQNMLFWDDRLDLYVGYTRVKETQILEEAAKVGITGRYRSIGRITSPDFKNWTPLEIAFEADAEDLAIRVPYQRDDPRPNIDIYTSCALKYTDAEDVYLMFPSMYYHWGENDYPATLDTQLATSRDGIHWQRQGERRSFLQLGFDRSSTSAMLFANPWLIPMGDELWLYYAGTARFHQEIPESEQRALKGKSGMFRASLRRDGFVSADAGYGGGELRTPLIAFAGDRLELNADGGAGGWLKVELQDADGGPIDGYSLEEADTVRGNGLAKTVTWRGSSEIGDLAGRPLRIRLVMRAMKLYAFQFCESRRQA